MAECKWCKDEFCVNADCPMVADYCPVPNNEGVCRYEERISDEKITCLNCKHLMFSDMYGECNKQLRIVNPSDTCEYAEPKERGGGSDMARYTDIDNLIAEYDRVHVGPAGGARKLMTEAPIADVAPKSEVAREIFEEIETSLCYKFINGEIHLIIREEDYKEYKKKYTEGKK